MKTLAAHQAYFFPYIGYFSVINRADIMVYMDSFQYERRSWMNRNRIIGEDGNVKYITVPVKKSDRETSANEVEIAYDLDWESRIINQLGYYKKHAPFYNDIIDMLEELFSARYDYISELAIKSVELVLNRLDISKKTFKTSEMECLKKVEAKSYEWGIHISKCFDDVSTYINAPGGKKFYDVQKYNDAGLDIFFLQNRLTPYDQKNDDFIPGLSIIDVMMFNSPEETRKMLVDCYVL